MQWEKIDEMFAIDLDAYYLVQTNGMEWRDIDLMVMSGHLVSLRSDPEYVRGRPVWVAKITRPKEI